MAQLSNGASGKPAPYVYPTSTAFSVPLVSRSEATMEAIERYILGKNLRPGDPLPTEATLCADLGVSRSSVREALRQLQALEIVSVQQGRGAFVGNMSLRPLVKTLLLRASISPDSVDALREVVNVRQVLDLGLASEVVHALKGTYNEELHAYVDVMVEKAAKSELFMDEDIAFHSGLISKVSNVLVEQLASVMWMIHMTALPSISESHTEGLDSTARAHKDMLLAAEAGDAAAYADAVRAHYAPLLHRLANPQS